MSQGVVHTVQDKWELTQWELQISFLKHHANCH